MLVNLSLQIEHAWATWRQSRAASAAPIPLAPCALPHSCTPHCAFFRYNCIYICRDSGNLHVCQQAYCAHIDRVPPRDGCCKLTGNRLVNRRSSLRAYKTLGMPHHTPTLYYMSSKQPPATRGLWTKRLFAFALCSPIHASAEQKQKARLPDDCEFPGSTWAQYRSTLFPLDCEPPPPAPGALPGARVQAKALARAIGKETTPRNKRAANRKNGGTVTIHRANLSLPVRICMQELFHRLTQHCNLQIQLGDAQQKELNLLRQVCLQSWLKIKEVASLKSKYHPDYHCLVVFYESLAGFRLTHTTPPVTIVPRMDVFQGVLPGISKLASIGYQYKRFKTHNRSFKNYMQMLYIKKHGQ